jgi:carboxyl-terminal processing protease
MAPPPSPPKARGHRVLLWSVLTIVIVGLLVGIGFAVDRAFFQNASGKDFKLTDSKSYQEALYDIEHYYYKDFSAAKITAAAEAAVAKAKKQGVTDVSKLENTGLSALIDALKEPHTDYLTADENKRLSEDISGSFYGVGFMLREDKATKRPIVFSVIKDSPADKAGIKKDDIILTVDGWDTKGQNLDIVVSRIRGKKGTQVVLKIQRAGEKSPLTFKITREKINIPEIESSIQDGQYGYVHVFNFNAGIGDKVRATIRDLQAKGAKGIILDLRNNPGGLLDEAVQVSSVFIDNGVIVSYQTKGSTKVDEKASGNAETNLPMVVLINGGSASSSEITAGALQDTKRAVLVGSKSYGKGSVQKIYHLSNGGAAKLTVSLYYLPNGESIDGKGLVPSVVVEDKNNVTQEEKLQLDAAKRVLQNLIEGKPATSEVLLPAA